MLIWLYLLIIAMRRKIRIDISQHAVKGEGGSVLMYMTVNATSMYIEMQRLLKAGFLLQITLIVR